MQPHSIEANGKATHPLFILLPCEALQSLASVFIIVAPSDSFFFLERAVLSKATACVGSTPAFLRCCQASLPVLPLQMHLFMCPSWAPLAAACSCFSLCLSTAPPRFLYCRAQHHLAGNLPEDCEDHEARGCILFSLVSVWPSSGPRPGKSSMCVLSDQWTRKPSSDGPERWAPWRAGGVLIYWVSTSWVTKKMPGNLREDGKEVEGLYEVWVSSNLAYPEWGMNLQMPRACCLYHPVILQEQLTTGNSLGEFKQGSPIYF